MDNKEEILREELKEVLSLPKIDYVRVLKLSRLSGKVLGMFFCFIIFCIFAL